MGEKTLHWKLQQSQAQMDELSLICFRDLLKEQPVTCVPAGLAIFNLVT